MKIDVLINRLNMVQAHRPDADVWIYCEEYGSGEPGIDYYPASPYGQEPEGIYL